MRATMMKTATDTPFEKFLNNHDEEAWAATLTTLLRSIHEVDKTATQIWFAFYPLSLYRALQAADDRAKLVQELLLQGNYYLKDQIDSSHKFFYGYRYWSAVKRAVEEYATEWHRLQSVSDQAQTRVYATKLADQILDVARSVAQSSKVDESLVVGITAVAFMTVQQAGLAAFKA